MIDKIKNLFARNGDSIEQYEVKASFKTEDGRHYERGETIAGVLKDWENESLAIEAADKRQMLESETAPVYTSRTLEFQGEPVESAALVPTEFLRARSGKVLVAPFFPGGGGET